MTKDAEQIARGLERYADCDWVGPAFAATLRKAAAMLSTPAPEGEVGELVERLRAPKVFPTKRPTIAELEVILAQPEPPPVQINPDGSIGVGGNLINPDGPKAADTILSLQARIALLEEAGEAMAKVLTDPIVGTVNDDEPYWYRALDEAVSAWRAVRGRGPA